MKPANYYLITILLLVAQLSSGQVINWDSSSNWKLYNIHNRTGFNYSMDTLAHFQSIELNDDSMHSFLSNAYLWPKDKYSMWMGLYIASCELEEKKAIKIIVSTYGGFFYIPSTKQYYQIRTELITRWFDLLNEKSKKVANE